MNLLLRRTNFLHKFSQHLRYVPTRGFALDDDGSLDSGKTTVSLLSEDHDDLMFFTGYSLFGFRLSSGIRVMGPCAVFARSVLHWNVAGIQDVTEASLSLFTILEPKIDILVLGVGEQENMGKLDFKVIKYLRSKKINLEVLPTDQALSTFNFLNSERRYVAGALIPPSQIHTRPETFLEDVETQNQWKLDQNPLLPYRLESMDDISDQRTQVLSREAPKQREPGLKTRLQKASLRAEEISEADREAQAKSYLKDALEEEKEKGKPTKP